MRKFLFVLPLLASLPSLVSACGYHAEESSAGITGLSILGINGFTGGFISALVVIVLVLTIALLIKKVK